MTSRLESFAARVERLTDKSDTDGCWLWLGKLNNRGYASLRNRKYRLIAIHRYVLGLGTRAEHPGHVDHLCGIRHCVNPKHLMYRTPQSHARRHNGWVDPDGGFCRNGHNTLVVGLYRKRSRGRLCFSCRACSSDYSRERNKRIKEGTF